MLFEQAIPQTVIICGSRQLDPEPKMEPLPRRIAGRIPSLDGMRAVAISMVILSHLGLGQIWGPVTFGNLGVRVFFVISGLLITTLLLDEQQATGTIGLKHFYIRRSLRILPAGYAYVGAMAIAVRMQLLRISPMSLFAGLLYFRNYDQGDDWYTAHLWSLSVEEQFYLIWPTLLAVLGRRSLFVLLGALPVASFMRLQEHGNAAFETNMDALACGAILAFMWGPLGRSERWQRFLGSRLFWIVPATILASIELSLLSDPYVAWGKTVANMLIAVAIERFVRYHGTGVARLLNSRPAVSLGTLSYSLYLWQQPWLYPERAGTLQRFPLNIACAFVAALLSYHLIERPLLHVRERLVDHDRSAARVVGL